VKVRERRKEDGMGNEVVLFTLSARDPEALAHFYRNLLAWDVVDARLTSSDSGASGTFRALQTGGLPGSISTEQEQGVVLMVKVDDLDSTIERARELGVMPVREGFELEGLGRGDERFQVAWMRDPEGNRLALVGSEA
jgi:predicted enzyme related to lactoylglutathione lyase